MKLSRLVAILILVGLAGPAGAAEVLVVQSAPLQPYQAAIQGFKQALEASAAHRGPRRVEPVAFKALRLTGSEPDPTLLQKVRDLKPDLVLAVGTPALKVLRDLREIPIVCIMVHSSADWVGHRPNVTGIEMAISPERWLETMRAALPDRKRLGLLYDPNKTGNFVTEAKAAAARSGITIVAREVASPREVHERLSELRGLVDAFWMLPDLTVVTPQSVESLRLFSLRNRVPIVSFSEEYLDLGATVALTLDFAAMGRQAGEMARRILDGAAVNLVPPESPRKVHVRVNRPVADKLGVVVVSSQPDTDD